MAEDQQRSRQVAFAERFASEPANMLNAYVAIARARHLMADAEEVAEVLSKERESDDPPLRPWYGFEVISFYQVGFVTALEWHARSRLTDLYTYKPEAIDAKALDGKVGPRVLAQMVRANVSIPQLLGASISIGTAYEYLGVFERLFEVLGIDAKAGSVIQPEEVEQIDIFGDPLRAPSVRERLDQLFLSRHTLVHEIGLTRMSSPSISENWDAAYARDVAHTVIEAMSALERVLTAHAPNDFPNLLDMRGYPVDERLKLKRIITALEDRITAHIESACEATGVDARDDWAHLLTGARDDAAALQDFIAESGLFEERYIDRKNALSVTFLRQRLAQLKQLDAELQWKGLIAEG